MARNCIASIDLNAIKKNYLYAKSLSPQSKAIAIIKANAYGHGAVEVARQLEDCADCYGVACTEEAIELRISGISNTPILLLEGIFEESELKLVDNYNLWMVVCNSSQLKWVLNCKLNNKFNVFVKIDSGMGRLGFKENEAIKAISSLKAANSIEKITLMTHFSSADNPDKASTKNQTDTFNRITKLNQSDKSLANSAALMSFADAHSEYTRPGIMLYGSSPFPFDNNFKNLSTVMTLESSLISVKKFKAGDAIGYGRRYICNEETLIGVVAIGYADGYPRSAKDGTPVYINGAIAKLAGKVSMDMITINLNGINNPKIGDRVELFGTNVSVDEVADYCDTISYEIFSKITSRVYKTYVS
ncbi:alanine racemase [bacterium]|nr:alanine racemase [bacterium]|tara:strand:+ start:2592 stop:3671 length:1080 start_codon:yes stop_codon:yes gene_type:complete